MARHVVARTAEIPEGGRKLVEVKGRPIYVAEGVYEDGTDAERAEAPPKG